MSVGVMKDYNLKQRNLCASHTLGWSWNCRFFIVVFFNFSFFFEMNFVET
jgi:hypothetical protein